MTTSPQQRFFPHLSELEARVLIIMLGRPYGSTGLRNTGAFVETVGDSLQQDAISTIDLLVDRLDLVLAAGDDAVEQLALSTVESAIVDEALRYAYATTVNETMFYAEYQLDRNRAWVLRRALHLDAVCERALTYDTPVGDVDHARELQALGCELRASRGARFESTSSVSMAVELWALNDAIGVAQGRTALGPYQGNVNGIRAAFYADIARTQARSAGR